LPNERTDELPWHGESSREMRMVKQSPGSNECGACVVAMLTDSTRDEILRDVPRPETKADFFWLTYMRDRGFALEDVRDDPGFDRTFAITGRVFNGHFQLPSGHRYYCTLHVAGRTHAVAIDEQGLVFDPSTTAPGKGSCTLEEYVRHNHKSFPDIFISCCYRVRAGRR
jgi:hypothetical protein